MKQLNSRNVKTSADSQLGANANHSNLSALLARYFIIIFISIIFCNLAWTPWPVSSSFFAFILDFYLIFSFQTWSTRYESHCRFSPEVDVSASAIVDLNELNQLWIFKISGQPGNRKRQPTLLSEITDSIFSWTSWKWQHRHSPTDLLPSTTQRLRPVPSRVGSINFFD